MFDCNSLAQLEGSDLISYVSLLDLQLVPM